MASMPCSQSVKYRDEVERTDVLMSRIRQQHPAHPMQTSTPVNPAAVAVFALDESPRHPWRGFSFSGYSFYFYFWFTNTSPFCAAGPTMPG
jgi:hypothetical protein